MTLDRRCGAPSFVLRRYRSVQSCAHSPRTRTAVRPCRPITKRIYRKRPKRSRKRKKSVTYYVFLAFYYIGAVIYIYFVVLSPTETERSAVSNNLELLSFLNEYDEKFGNHFDYELSRWFASQIKITSNAEKSQELLGLLDDHDAEMESIAGITSEQLDDFREKQSYAFLSTAVLNNATEDEVGKLVEIYMRTMTFIRARKLQNFTASFLVQPWKTRLSDFEDILISADRRVLDAINSLDMLDNLKSLAKEFWKSYSSAHTPGIKESCLVYRSNSETLDYDEILDRIRVAIMMQVTSCIPPEYEGWDSVEKTKYEEEDFGIHKEP
ncbi:hypothetical protein QR680_007899 [Steinernema hermaphroditum]|uniref:Uncharacterized protein n=1 Tax=Steinernema hermaphroditum TaxID=289476 RepID=A0AA39IH21_9BILA|nr:hypothetical protein QR680_007899 [Steinernema hermaphroditum]